MIDEPWDRSVSFGFLVKMLADQNPGVHRAWGILVSIYEHIIKPPIKHFGCAQHHEGEKILLAAHVKRIWLDIFYSR